jgi:hypothetical protein
MGKRRKKVHIRLVDGQCTLDKAHKINGARGRRLRSPVRKRFISNYKLLYIQRSTLQENWDMNSYFCIT